ncbi:MAG: hypothetical protein LBH17_02695 [Oscillospiraceae bacterium]|jgi:hypothetical protein|nr:hypothetical protein [Oscillospiraceae bacterium]
MALIKKPPFAAVVAVIVCIASLFIGTSRSFTAEAKKIEDMFYSGIYNPDENYTAPSIDNQISICQDSALGLLTVSTNYTHKSEDVKMLSAELREARLESLDTTFNTIPPTNEAISYRFRDYIHMYGFFVLLYESLADAGLSARDRERADMYMDMASSSFTYAISQATELRKHGDHLLSLLALFPARLITQRQIVYDVLIPINIDASTSGHSGDKTYIFMLDNGQLTAKIETQTTED